MTKLSRRLLLTPIPLALAGAALAGPAQGPGEAVVRRFWDALNRGALDELDACVTPGYRHHPNGATQTLADFKSGAKWILGNTTDYRLEIHDLVENGDRVAIRWTASGQHTGSYFGEKPTGKLVTSYGMHFYRVEGGRIAEDWEVIDFAAFRKQLS
jgi:predicted ester cyclase